MFKFWGSDKRIIDAIKLADSFFNDPIALYGSIVNDKISKYEYSTATPYQLAEIMDTFWRTHTVVVKTYSPRNWLGFPKKSNVLAYTSDSKTIYINANNLNRSLESIAGTLAHEYVHCSDNACSTFTFGHGNNSSHKKESTFPYAFGKNVKNWLERRSNG